MVKKKSTCNVGVLVRSLVWEDPLEECTAIHCSILAWKIALTEAPWGQKESDRRVTQHKQEIINERDRKNCFLKKKKKFRRFRAGTSQGNAPSPPKPGYLLWGLIPAVTAGSAESTAPQPGGGGVLPPGGHWGAVWRHFGFRKGQESGAWRPGHSSPETEN